MVLPPPLQPMLEATDKTPRARTSATRIRFIESSSKLWPQIEQQRGSSWGQADPDPDLLFCGVANRDRFPLENHPQPIPRLRVGFSSTGQSDPSASPVDPIDTKPAGLFPQFFHFWRIFPLPRCLGLSGVF